LAPTHRQGSERSFRVDKVHALERNAAIACRQGLGTLIAKLSEQVPLALSTPASRVAWSGRDVTVETPAGKIAARAAIVTVSSNVLAAGNIKFTPEIPKRQLDAAAKLNLAATIGSCCNCRQSAGAGARRHRHRTKQFNADGAVVCQYGTVVAVLDRCRRLVRTRSLSQGEPAMVAFAVEWLTKLFGSEWAAAVNKSSATRWDAAPFVQGAMSVAAPGAQPSRKVLTEPIGCMFLAGEATHETLWGTVDGAWESGERAAEAALQKIGGLKDESAAAPVAKPRRRAAPAKSAMPGIRAN